jgi:hypothetical protein
MRIITGSRAENPVVVPKEPEEPQEVSEADEKVGEDLKKCPNHRLSSFERGKPRSIISLLLYKALYYIYVIYMMH